LPARDRNWFDAAATGDFCRVKTVTPPRGFCMNNAQIRCDRFHGRSRASEAQQLGMAGVTPRLTSENRLREERFSPERDQPAGIQVFRV
jgi:hypothetical protein